MKKVSEIYSLSACHTISLDSFMSALFMPCRNFPWGSCRVRSEPLILTESSEAMTSQMSEMWQMDVSKQWTVHRDGRHIFLAAIT